MLKRGTQVLSNRQDINIVLAYVVHDLDDFIPCLAQAQHKAGLGWSGRIHLFGPFQHLK